MIRAGGENNIQVNLSYVAIYNNYMHSAKEGQSNGFFIAIFK